MVHVPKGKDDLRCKSDQRQQREPTMPPQRAHDGPPSLCYTITLRDRAWSSEKGRKEALSGKRVAERIQVQRTERRQIDEKSARQIVRVCGRCDEVSPISPAN